MSVLSCNGSYHKARGHWYAVKILIAAMQANNKCCSFLTLLIFFLMQDLEAEKFVYLSIKNETERIFEYFDRNFYSHSKEDGTNPFLYGIFTGNC